MTREVIVKQESQERIVRQDGLTIKFNTVLFGNGLADPMTHTGDMIYNNADGSPARLPIGSVGEVLSIIDGLPSWESVAGASNPLTTLGDILYGGAAGVQTRLGIGSAGQILTVTGGIPAWATPAAGFADPMTTTGDIIYRSAGGTTRLGIGSNGQVLKLASGVPTWAAEDGGEQNSFTPSGGVKTIIGRLLIDGANPYITVDTAEMSGVALRTTINSANFGFGTYIDQEPAIFSGNATQPVFYSTGTQFRFATDGVIYGAINNDGDSGAFFNALGAYDSGSPLTIYGRTADAANAVSVIMDSEEFTTSGAKLLSVRNLNVEKFSVDYEGSIVTDRNLTMGAGSTLMASGVDGQLDITTSNDSVGLFLGTGGNGNVILSGDSLTISGDDTFTMSSSSFIRVAATALRGNVTTLALEGAEVDDATAVAVSIDNTISLTNAAGKLLSVRNATVEKLHIKYTGALESVSTLQGTQLISTIATGTAPLTVASTTVVSNLNASLLGGNAASYYNPMTTSGDIIYGGVSGLPTRLPVGTNTHVLTLTAGVPGWAAPAAGGVAIGDSPTWTGTHTFNNSIIVNGLTTRTADVMSFSSSTADGSSAVGFKFDTSVTLANSNAKIANFKNNGTEEAYVDLNGCYVLARNAGDAGGIGNYFGGAGLKFANTGALMLGMLNFPGVTTIGAGVTRMYMTSKGIVDFKQNVNVATGDEVAFLIQPTINKATSGSVTTLQLQSINTAVPGTDNKLIDAQWGTTTKFKADYKGTTSCGTGNASTALMVNHGVIARNTTAVGNVTTGEDDLMTHSLAANSFDAAGRGVRVTAWGTTAANVNAKTLKFYFGAVALTTSLTTVSANKWYLEAIVFSTGTDAQDYVAKLLETGLNLPDVENGALTQDDGAAITIKLTGEATDTNDIVQEGMLIEFLN